MIRNLQITSIGGMNGRRSLYKRALLCYNSREMNMNNVRLRSHGIVLKCFKSFCDSQLEHRSIMQGGKKKCCPSRFMGETFRNSSEMQFVSVMGIDITPA